MSGRIETAQHDHLSLTLPDVKSKLREMKPKRPTLWSLLWLYFTVTNIIQFATTGRALDLFEAVGCALILRSEWGRKLRARGTGIPALYNAGLAIIVTTCIVDVAS